MGPEIIAAIVGPILGGSISITIFLQKKNAEFFQKSFDRLHGSVESIERKVDDLSLNVAKNYVTNDALTAHITGEEAWHIRFGDEMSQMRDEVIGTRVIVDRMWLDFQNKGNS